MERRVGRGAPRQYCDNCRIRQGVLVRLRQAARIAQLLLDTTVDDVDALIARLTNKRNYQH